jgi:hypothetical protein
MILRIVYPASLRETELHYLLILLLIFCRALWLMPPDVPQPVWLIVFTLL